MERSATWIRAALMVAVVSAAVSFLSVARAADDPSGRFYLRAGIGIDWSDDTRFTDENCMTDASAPLYGCGEGPDGAPLNSSGDFGTMVGLEVGGRACRDALPQDRDGRSPPSEHHLRGSGQLPGIDTTAGRRSRPVHPLRNGLRVPGSAGSRTARPRTAPARPPESVRRSRSRGVPHPDRRDPNGVPDDHDFRPRRQPDQTVPGC